jgi:hypothetical protein
MESKKIINHWLAIVLILLLLIQLLLWIFKSEWIETYDWIIKLVTNGYIFLYLYHNLRTELRKARFNWAGRTKWK